MPKVECIFLVPAGRDRFELYSEPPDDELEPAPGREEGRIRQWVHKAQITWHELVEGARRGAAQTGRIARWRNAVVCRLAESIAEQRTLWGLRETQQATARYPATIDAGRARAVLDRILADSRRHHLRWFIVDLVLFIASGVLFFVPGPNIIAYYIFFRLIGHFMSWRGARQSIEGVQWQFDPDPGLAELASLVDEPRAARAPKVAAIAERLNLRRLSAFFDRIAVPSS